MERSAIYHVACGIFCYAVAADTLNIRLRISATDRLAVHINYKDLYDHTERIMTKAMTRLLDDGVSSIYEVSITIPTKHFKYYFTLQERDDTAHYTASGFVLKPDSTDYFYYSAINQDDILRLPQWARGELIYQLLVDRFHDGEPLNNPPGVKPWGALPDRSTYYGGDFAGISQKLPYLKGLGVKIIYLSPVFISPTYHKYDIVDYYAIETIYGGEAGLRHLVDSAHQEGIRIILDAVFNHCSSEHPFFQDLLAKQEHSPYRDWFFPESFPVSREFGNYDNFANQVPSMPKFNTANPDVINYLTDQAIFWLERLDIDGYRLDVADEVSHRLWRELRQKVKSKRPDALLLGEIWNHATAWLSGSELDTTTNYRFRKLMVELVAGKIDANEFALLHQANLMHYQTPLHPYLVNLIGSHDTERFVTLAGDVATHHLALQTMLVFEGMPLLYYGDELAMPGGKDPDNRRAMAWTDVCDPLSEMTKTVAQYRSRSDILRYGTQTFAKSGGQVLRILRSYQGRHLLIIANFTNLMIGIDPSGKQVELGEATLENGLLQIPAKRLAIFTMAHPTMLEK